MKTSRTYYYLHAFRDFNYYQVDLLHFFNTISYGKTPWVTTYEGFIPRFGKLNKKLMEKGMRLIASDACKQIIAMSACADRIQRSLMHNDYPRYADAIEPKMSVLHPPQPKLISHMGEKEPIGEEVVFTLVGATFFRKGGKEVLIALDRLAREGYRNWRLIIVSKMVYGDYASKATKEDYEDALRIIARHPKNIEHHSELPNDQVLDLFRRSHVGLLPTYGDSYGYSVLEAQASGCPVVSTNLRALPEINNEEIGWMIPIPTDEWGNGVISTPQERSRFSDILVEHLTEITRNILEDPGQVTAKGEKALAKFDGKRHDPTANATVLEALYDEILAAPSNATPVLRSFRDASGSMV
jgi:glycosyltransferase involved in cell wall biosynthesis